MSDSSDVLTLSICRHFSSGVFVYLRDVGAFGNVLSHAYHQVDPARIWELITTDLTPMAEAAEPTLLRLEKARES